VSLTNQKMIHVLKSLEKLSSTRSHTPETQTSAKQKII